MTMYRVMVYVQYDDCIELDADSPEDAKAMAEAVAYSNMGVYASADINAYEPEVIDE